MRLTEQQIADLGGAITDRERALFASHRALEEHLRKAEAEACREWTIQAKKAAVAERRAQAALDLLRKMQATYAGHYNRQFDTWPYGTCAEIDALLASFTAEDQKEEEPADGQR